MYVEPCAICSSLWGKHPPLPAGVGVLGSLTVRYLLPWHLLSTSRVRVSLSGWIRVWFGPGPIVLAISAG